MPRSRRVGEIRGRIAGWWQYALGHALADLSLEALELHRCQADQCSCAACFGVEGVRNVLRAERERARLRERRTTRPPRDERARASRRLPAPRSRAARTRRRCAAPASITETESSGTSQRT